MMDLNNNQFKLDTLPSKPARPTIPYAQFPRPTLQDPEASFENRRRRSETESDGSATSRGSFNTLDGAEEMQSGASSRHTRRRSARRPVNTDADGITRDGEQEEVRWSREEDAWSEEDSKSNSDNAGYSGRSDDDQDDEETGLTGTRSKKSRRRRDSRLDRRIVKDSEITREEKKEADQSVIKNMLINGMFIGLWSVNALPMKISVSSHPCIKLTKHQVHLLPLHLHLQ